MAVTLEQAKLNVQDDLQKAVIDEFQKSNWLWANLQFENVVNPSGGGATLTYAYLRVKTQPTAAFRAIYEEYTAQEATKEKITADLAIFGGSYKIDRIIARMAGDEVAFQASQKIKAASALFNETVINGDTATNTKAFDGLEKALTGSSTEVKPATAIDLSGSSEMDTNYKSFLDAVDEMLGNMDGTPSALLMGSKMYNKFRGVIRRATAYQETKDAFGRISRCMTASRWWTSVRSPAPTTPSWLSTAPPAPLPSTPYASALTDCMRFPSLARPQYLLTSPTSASPVRLKRATWKW